MAISVILCTYNPQRFLLNWALDSLEKQTLPKPEFEVLVVDNNSDPPLEEARLRQGRTLALRLVREPRQGLAFARCAGINAAGGDLLVFMDDDNHLDPDYLEQALRISREEPSIGLFGGIARPLLEGSIPLWQENLLPYLGVRDYGSEPITSTEDCWGEWEPIGAGMVSRRDVAELFVEIMSSASDAGSLGRNGRTLMSGEDSLFARAANRLGYACSYQPRLRLLHFIKKSRLTLRVLARTLEGHGRSFVILQSVVGRPIEAVSLVSACRELYGRYLMHVKKLGKQGGTIVWFWDLGYFREALRKG